jgi:hypothetical protein
LILTKQSKIATSKKIKIEINKDKNKQPIVKYEVPKNPKYLPNSPAKQEPKKDKNITIKYIFYFCNNRIQTYI